VTARREYGGAIAACITGAGLVLLTLRESWARVIYAAPSPLPSGSVSVSGQNLRPGAGGLALAALACLAAVIATRGLARRLAGLAMAGLGAWAGWLVSAPVHAAAVISAAAGQASSGEFAGGSLPGGNSAIGGGTGSGGGGLPAIGAASHVVLATFPWRSAAVAGAIVVIAVGLVTAWRGPGWPVMSSRFDRPDTPGAAGLGVAARSGTAVEDRSKAGGSGVSAGSGPARSDVPAGSGTAVGDGPAASGRGASAGSSPAGPGVAVRSGAAAGDSSEAGGRDGPAGSGLAGPGASSASQAVADESATPASSPASGQATAGGGEPADDAAGGAYREDDAAALWEALDRGVDLTDAPG
jgi:hypothetical protein